MYHIKNCSFFRKIRKFVKFFENRKKNKIDKQKQKIYNVNDFFFDNNIEFLNIDLNNKKNIKKIVVLFKKLINIIFKFE